MSLLGEVGTLAWTRRTKGILGRGERARYIAATVLASSGGLGRIALWKRGRGGQGGPDPSALTPPDSKVARDAAAECAELMEPAIMEHNYRSYLYARALGLGRAIEPDEEQLFVAIMFHDAGIRDVSERCFTLGGADRAADFAGRAGMEARAAETMGNAICLHINPEVGTEHGAEAHLAHDGILLDALGLRVWELDRVGVEGVRERHPRLRFTQEAGALLGEHAKRMPQCRIAAAFTAGFGLALHGAAWRD